MRQRPSETGQTAEIYAWPSKKPAESKLVAEALQPSAPSLPHTTRVKATRQTPTHLCDRLGSCQPQWVLTQVEFTKAGVDAGLTSCTAPTATTGNSSRTHAAAAATATGLGPTAPMLLLLLLRTGCRIEAAVTAGPAASAAAGSCPRHTTAVEIPLRPPASHTTRGHEPSRTTRQGQVRICGSGRHARRCCSSSTAPAAAASLAAGAAAAAAVPRAPTAAAPCTLGTPPTSRGRCCC